MSRPDRLMDHWDTWSVEQAEHSKKSAGDGIPGDGEVYLALAIAASAAVTALAAFIYVGQTLWQAGKLIKSRRRH